jgi:hydroxyacylglutathione hydrolase
MLARVIPVPCLTDNYAYLVYDDDGDGDCLVVDPSEAEPVLSEVSRLGLRLSAIFNTHHHWDHVGGNNELLALRKLRVYGHESESARIPGLNQPLSHGERFASVGLEFFVLHVPGHTSGALALCSTDRQLCFTGDTLFCGGCGRLFEGSAEQMHHSLTTVLAQLPDETRIYCGHEYTENNLKFALGIDPTEAVFARLQEVEVRRARGEFCASASLGLERATNPFLRCHISGVRQALGVDGSDQQAFAELRRRKDRA